MCSSYKAATSGVPIADRQQMENSQTQTEMLRQQESNSLRTAIL